jgi:hypothetical protein
LLRKVGCSLPVEHLGVAAGAEPRACAALGRALAAGQRTALLVCRDVDEPAQLWVAGRPAWQVRAGAALGGRWDAQVTYAAQPYGVHYVVATWLATEA